MTQTSLLLWPLGSQLFALLKSIRKDSRQIFFHIMKKNNLKLAQVNAAQVISLKSSLLFPALSSGLPHDTSSPQKSHPAYMQHTFNTLSL